MNLFLVIIFLVLFTALFLVIISLVLFTALTGNLCNKRQIKKRKRN
jgi:hypothetical protein